MSRMNWRVGMLVAVVGVLALSSAGCSWRIGRIFGETSFICGATRATDTHTRHQVAEATRLALRNMGFTIETEEWDRDSGMLEAVKGRNTVRVHLTDGEGGGTNISYHIDSFGKWFAAPRRIARTALAKTRESLGSPAPAPTPAPVPAPAPAPAPAPKKS